jgi:hypothetical protein
VGVFIGGGELINAGYIDGGSGGFGSGGQAAQGDAVVFGADAARLVVEAGAFFGGDVVANVAAQDVLELGGTASGTLSGLGTQFTGFSSIAVDAGAGWTLSGANTLTAVTALVDKGALTVTGTLNDAGSLSVVAGAMLSSTGSLAFLGAAANSGVIEAAGGSVRFAEAVTGVGTLAIGAASVLGLQAGAGAGQMVDFLGGSGALDLVHPLDFAGVIAGFGGNDRIDLVATVATAFDYAGGVLTVQDGGIVVAALRLQGSYTQADFKLGADGHGGTVVTFV